MHHAYIISVGKQKDSAIATLVDEYRKRMQGKITEIVLNASQAPQALQTKRRLFAKLSPLSIKW